jgi:hypothetical protein
MRPLGRLLVFLMALVSMCAAHASPLNLVLSQTPDILVQLTDMEYDAGTDLFTADGLAVNLNDDGSPDLISGGNFSLSASIDDTGTLAGGTLSVTGTIAGLGYNSGTLLTGNLTAFGFLDGGGDPLEFLFEVTGGDAAGLYPSVAGAILTSTGFGGIGDFTTGFTNSGTGNVNIAPVPLPAAVWLFVTGVLGLAGLGRAHRQS